MRRTERYQVARTTQQMLRVAGIAPEPVLRRAGLPADYLENEGRGSTPAQIFALWDAAMVESRRPDLPIDLARIFARGPFNSAIFAFSCSPDIATGLKRLALFKPLVGPLRLEIRERPDSFEIGFASVDPGVPLPDCMAVFETVYFLELVRFYTGETIQPLAVHMRGHAGLDNELKSIFEVPLAFGGKTALVLSAVDARRPLISENEEMWRFFEPQLRRKLAERDRQTPMNIRVKNVLLEMLPAGVSTADAVCERLHLSKRSLQRQLRDEGVTYQAVLDATRSELSMHYLASDEMSVEEISYLLAYRDPNSFYRAFHAWTGMTPQEARSVSRN